MTISGRLYAINRETGELVIEVRGERKRPGHFYRFSAPPDMLPERLCLNQGYEVTAQVRSRTEPNSITSLLQATYLEIYAVSHG